MSIERESGEEIEKTVDAPVAVREFLPEENPRFALWFPLIGLFLGFFLGTGFFGAWGAAFLFLGLVIGGVVGGLVDLIFPPKKTSILVGIDGVQVRTKFVPYSDVQEVILEGKELAGDPDMLRTYGVDDASYAVTLRLVRRDSEPVRVTSFNYPPSAVKSGLEDARREPVVKAIEEGLSAWRARQDDPDLAAEALVARGQSTPREWLTRLRALGSGAAAMYRAPAVSRDVLSQLLTNQAARPSTRAAAALALKAADDSPSRSNVRIDNTEFADTSLRVALDDLDSAEDDADILEALQEIEAAERREWTPPQRK